ncbi:hypothetical protein OQA88_3524 [Cercophora sp. LCS_1]
MRKNTLGNGEWLKVGESLWSEDGSVEFKMQGDGKIAVYWGGKCQYQSSREQRNDIKGIQMQPDGNLVMYNNSDKAVWHTDTASPIGDSTVVCSVQNDGNVVLYKGTSVWATSTQK